MAKQVRAKYVQMAKQDQLRYNQELQQLTLGMDEKPSEPVRARTPYMFFVRDCRDCVKRDKKDILKRDIMSEVGKMWNLVKTGAPV